MACPRPPRLVVDVDVGSDDAMGLMVVAAAERKGSARLLGVTCVHGNTDLDHVCANALKTLHTIGRLDVPVYRGAHASLVDTMKRAEDIHGGDGFGDFEYEGAPDVETHLQKEHAVLYLTRVVRETPGSITLLCLGPLTNIALAIRMDKDFCTNVKEIIIMGGNVEGIGNVTAAAEFNFHCDPEAAYITVHNMKCPVTILPWETAFNHCALPYLPQVSPARTVHGPRRSLDFDLRTVKVVSPERPGAKRMRAFATALVHRSGRTDVSFRARRSLTRALPSADHRTTAGMEDKHSGVAGQSAEQADEQGGSPDADDPPLWPMGPLRSHSRGHSCRSVRRCGGGAAPCHRRASRDSHQGRLCRRPPGQAGAATERDDREACGRGALQKDHDRCLFR
ncbi:uncharacterized protein LOC134539685 isoform X1 [Bacillus rossius redtenbacheri]|uniref:uncharacterized protein LOC134539685 isoform X1 n=1 Tax=Bacillus rossius redtenbacheri TaxID=93214 RepID=UPI002FDCB3D5